MDTQEENVNLAEAKKRIDKIVERNMEYADLYVYTGKRKTTYKEEPRPKCNFPKCDKDTVGRSTSKFCDDHNTGMARHNALRWLGLEASEAAILSKIKNLPKLLEKFKEH